MDYIHRKIASHYTFYRRSLVKGGILSLSREGKLLAFETSDNPDALAGVEFYNGILIPDLVNAHCHLELSYMRGALEGGGGFTSFAKGMSRHRHDYPAHHRALQATIEDARLWSEGVGAIGDVCNSMDTFGIKRESRIRYVNFLELFGLGRESAEALVPVAKAALEVGLKYTITPHSTYSLTDEAFAAAIAGVDERNAEYCEETGISDTSRPPLSIHFMESPQESELFDCRGEMWQWNNERGMPMPFASRYKNPTDRLINLVPPERDILLIHNCTVTEEDIDKIHHHFKGRVTWVLCPRSNDFISHLKPPVALLRRKGMHIAVGTDSLASNRSLSMAEEMKSLGGDVPLTELLAWVTENGADALHLGDVCGRFEAGQKTGVVRLSGIDMNKMAITENLSAERIV